MFCVNSLSCPPLKCIISMFVEKTTKMLFRAAAQIDANNDSDRNNRPTSGVTGAADAPPPAHLYEQYQLIGDGNIILRDMNPDVANPSLERRLSVCCQKPTFIQGICANCTFDLCEECGYSCVECSQFICRTCVTLLYVLIRYITYIYILIYYFCIYSLQRQSSR